MNEDPGKMFLTNTGTASTRTDGMLQGQLYATSLAEQEEVHRLEPERSRQQQQDTLQQQRLLPEPVPR